MLACTRCGVGRLESSTSGLILWCLWPVATFGVGGCGARASVKRLSYAYRWEWR